MKTFQLDCLHAILKRCNQLLLAIRPFSSDYERLVENEDEDEEVQETENEKEETAKNEIKKKEKKKLRKSSKK